MSLNCIRNTSDQLPPPTSPAAPLDHPLFILICIHPTPPTRHPYPPPSRHPVAHTRHKTPIIQTHMQPEIILNYLQIM